MVRRSGLLPSISPLSDPHGAPQGEVAVPPPLRFRAPAGTIRDVSINALPYRKPGKANSFAKQAGLRYEHHAQGHLQKLWDNYLPAPHLHFRDDSGARTCIPDGLLVLPDRTVIFEIKSQHMPESWWQLRRLYQPVVEALYQSYNVQLVEVTRSYDVAMPFPTPIRLFHTPQELKRSTVEPITGFGVYLWRPQ